MSNIAAVSSESSSTTTPAPTINATPINQSVFRDALQEILGDIPAFRFLAATGVASGSPSQGFTLPTVPPSSSGGSVPQEMGTRGVQGVKEEEKDFLVGILCNLIALSTKLFIIIM